MLQARCKVVNMKSVDIQDAEANIDRLIEDAEKGKPFIISIDGKPVVKVKHMEKSEIEHLPKPEDSLSD
jgi:antitoxin (DNA-binding transcriptional repressor) of toxin-antitoxin stability system